MTTYHIPLWRLSGPNALFVKRVENGGMVLCKKGLIFIEWKLFEKLPLGTPLLIHKSLDGSGKQVVGEAFSHLAPENFEWTDKDPLT